MAEATLKSLRVNLPEYGIQFRRSIYSIVFVGSQLDARLKGKTIYQALHPHWYKMNLTKSVATQ